MRQIHMIPPLYDQASRILVLGSFPSVKSREQSFFYGHPQNRFWRVTAAVFDSETPLTTAEKKAFLLSHGLAIWDVIASCDIEGSSDSSIKNVIANDIGIILDKCDIKRIFVNGKTADRLYKEYILPRTGRKAICLPSTSPANAAWSLERLIQEWSQIKEWIS